MLVPLPKLILILFLLSSLFNVHFKSSLCYRTLSGLSMSSFAPSCVRISGVTTVTASGLLSSWMESLVRSLEIDSLSINAYFSPRPSYASLREGCGFPFQTLLCVKERSSQIWAKLKDHPWEMSSVMQMLEMTVICLLASLPITVLRQRHSRMRRTS